MEKFYIVDDNSNISVEYHKYKDMSEKVNDVFKQFAKEHGIQAKKYYQTVSRLEIVPTENDIEKFREQFMKGTLGTFKKTSLLCKEWVLKCKELGLQTPNRPYLPICFDCFGKSSSRIFEIDGTVYVSFESESNFNTPPKFKEIKASEFYKVIEESN